MFFGVIAVFAAWFVEVQYRWDGMATHDSTGKNTSSSYDASTAYTAPTAITANGLTTTLQWTDALGLKRETGSKRGELGVGLHLYHLGRQ